MESRHEFNDGRPYDYSRTVIAYSATHSIDVLDILTPLERFTAKPLIEFKIGDIDVKAVRLDNRALSVDEAIDVLRNEPRLEHTTFERDYRLSKLITPNDAYYGGQWALQTIEVEAAWDRVAQAGQGRGPVRVAIIDSGAMSGAIGVHEDLDATRLVGKRQSPPGGNNFDDDVGHGTLLAGIIAAVTNNNLGIAGMAGNPSPLSTAAAPIPDVRLFAAKFDDMRTPPSALLAVLAINDAIAWGAQVINISWHTLDIMGLLYQAILFAGQAQSILVVAAAGNDGSDNTQIPVAPATFGLANILPVMASDGNDNKPGFSNYGANVDIAAPGEGILSTSIYYVAPPVPPSPLYNPAYREFSGTSVAAAHVTGAAALLLAIDNWTPSEIRDHLVASATQTRGLQGTCRANGRLNLRQAVLGPFTLIDPPPPRVRRRKRLQLPGGSQYTVRWRSAYNSPVVGAVEITISGLRRPLTPAGGVPNIGRYQVTLPTGRRNNAVLRLRCVQKQLYTESAPFDII